MNELNNRGWNYSEEYRNECEAKDLLTWPLAKRRKQLALIYEKRGEAGYNKLTEEMTRQWTLARTKQSSSSSNNQESLPKQKQIELI
jgi:hypothetical protein